MTPAVATPVAAQVGLHIDIDSERCGNEARFVNDYRGTGVEGPNAQFWPYFDTSTGERRMAVKTIKPITVGSEVLVAPHPLLHLADRVGWRCCRVGWDYVDPRPPTLFDPPHPLLHLADGV